MSLGTIPGRVPVCQGQEAGKDQEQRMIQMWGFPEIPRLWNQPYPLAHELGPAPHDLPLWWARHPGPPGDVEIAVSLHLCFASQVQSVCSGGLVPQLPEVLLLPRAASPGWVLTPPVTLCCSRLPWRWQGEGEGQGLWWGWKGVTGLGSL